MDSRNIIMNEQLNPTETMNINKTIYPYILMHKHLNLWSYHFTLRLSIHLWLELYTFMMQNFDTFSIPPVYRLQGIGSRLCIMVILILKFPNQVAKGFPKFVHCNTITIDFQTNVNLEFIFVKRCSPLFSNTIIIFKSHFSPNVTHRNCMQTCLVNFNDF